jgi:hypothetical protein
MQVRVRLQESLVRFSGRYGLKMVDLIPAPSITRSQLDFLILPGRVNTMLKKFIYV